MAPDRPPGERVDLHGCPPAEALARLSRGLHRARVRGVAEVEVITGRGLGNPTWTPVLRGQVEAWLGGEEGRRHGVRGFRRARHGGALVVRLGTARAAGEAEEADSAPERGQGLEGLGPEDLGLGGWDPADESA